MTVLSLLPSLKMAAVNTGGVRQLCVSPDKSPALWALPPRPAPQAPPSLMSHQNLNTGKSSDFKQLRSCQPFAMYFLR